MTTITTRSGKGSPLTNNEVDANFTNLNDDKVEASGDSMTGNLSFGDNNKAIFGAGSDLQIYHDGSNSFITENGTGYLGIGTNGSKVIINKSPFENMAEFITDGAVNLYHNNVQRFATTSTGIDVTGTVTASHLTLSDSFPVLKIEDSDGTNQKLEIVSSSGASFLTARNGSSHGTINLRRTNGTTTSRTMQVQSSGDVALYADDGTTQAFYWDASTSRLGLGTLLPSGRVHANGDAYTAFIADGTSGGAFKFYKNGSQHAQIFSDGSGDIVFRNNTDSERMRITSSNAINFNLNSGSISHGFQYNENGGELALYDDTGAAATLLDQANNNTRLLELIDGSNIQIGIGGSNTTGALIFTKASGNEFGRITGSGFFGINNTNPDTTLHIGDISATNATGQGQIKLEATSGDIAHDAGLEFVGSSFGSGYGWKLTTIDSSGVHLGFGTRQNATAWSEKMRLLGDGRVAIGDTTTNNTANRLKVQGSQGDDRIAISTANTSSNASVEAQVANYWSGTTYTGTAIVQYDSAASGTTAGISNANLGMLRFQNGSAGLILTNGSQPIHFGTVGTTRMTLDASGNLLVGTATTRTGNYSISLEPSNSLMYFRAAGTGSIQQAIFVRDTTGTPVSVGSIATTGTATAYNTSSDQRLKDNIVDAPSASDEIDAIQVRSFDWKADGSHQKYGMVAQELNTVAPDAVTIPDDPEEMAGVDYSKLVPMLVKEIQSLRARVAQLEGAN